MSRSVIRALSVVALLALSVVVRGQDAAGEQPRMALRLSADFLQDTLLPRPARRSEKPLQNQVLEAEVRGWQNTESVTSLQVEPDPSAVRLLFTVRGTVRSQTVGVTRQASIDSSGRHSFELTKLVVFDGDRFLTSKAYGRVTATQQPLRIRTQFSGTPLIGEMAERTAWNAVYRRQPETLDAVVRWVASDVVPDVNRRVDDGVVRLNAEWRRLQDELAAVLPTGPGRWTGRSEPDGVVLVHSPQTEPLPPAPEDDFPPVPAGKDQPDVLLAMNEAYAEHLTRNRGVEGLTLAADDASAGLAAVFGFDAPLHHGATSEAASGIAETEGPAVTNDNVLTIPPGDDWPLPGSGGSPSDIVSDTESPARSERLTARPTASPTDGWKVRFDAARPVGFRFDDGRIGVRVRMVIMPPAGPETPSQDVEVTLRSELLPGDHWTLVTDDVIVRDTATSEEGGLIRDLMGSHIRSLLDDAPRPELPRLVQFRLTDGAPLTSLRLHQIRTEAGQLVTEFRRVSGPTFDSGVAEE